jgi:diaminopimelate decarboxylase
VNVDSVPELLIVEEIASEKRKKVRISFRINPNVDPRTHPKIATGLKGSKFGLHIEDGIAFEAYRKAKDMEHLDIVGLHTHIGSQIKESLPFVDPAEKVMEFAHTLKEKLGIRLEFIDLGGGLGIPYQGEKTITPEDLAAAVVPIIGKWNKKLGYEPRLWLEPGRYIVADAGILLARVQTIKVTPYRKFINLDAGFNTLIRPAMYDAYHRITVVGKETAKATEKYDVAGSVCESGDLFAKERELPKAEAGDLMAIHDAGAYGYAMASRYNSRPMPPEVLIRRDGSYEIVRERESIEDLFRGQKIPKDLPRYK